MKKPPTKRISRLLARHLRESERGKRNFDRSTTALDAAITLGVPLGEPVLLPDGRKVCVTDQFATSNKAFSAKLFQRYKVSDYREPKPPKAAKAEEQA